MDGVPQTTFIPRKPVADTAYARGGSSGSRRFTVFCVMVFILIALIAAGLFGYQYYLNNLLKNTQSTLTQTLNQFDPGLISQMSDLSTRLSTAQTVLQNHVALSEFFSFLGSVTIHSVRFTSFSYSTADGTMTVTLNGEAANFAALDAQELQLSEDTSGFITSPSISNIALTSTGSVTFTLSGTIPANVVSYQQEVDTAASSQSQIQAQAQNQPQNLTQ